MRRNNLAALTSLRFFAAGAVVLGHSFGKWGLPRTNDIGLHLGIGVDFFFVLSGFILAYNYPVIENNAHALRIIAYRIARIWPLHLVMLAVWFFFARNPNNPLNGIEPLWANVLLIQAWFGSYLYAYSGNAPSWTLSVELAFYLAFPFLVMLRTRTLIAVAILVSAATLIAAAILWSPGKVTDPGINGPAIVRMHPGSFVFLFVGGMLTARIFPSRTWQIGALPATMIEAACLALAIWFFVDHRDISFAVVRALDLGAFWVLWAPHVLGALFFAPLILSVSIGAGLVTKALSVKPLVFLGEISFATYLVHQPLQTWLLRNGFNGLEWLPLFVGCIFIASCVAYLGIERPAQKWLRGRIDAIHRQCRAAAATC